MRMLLLQLSSIRREGCSVFLLGAVILAPFNSFFWLLYYHHLLSSGIVGSGAGRVRLGAKDATRVWQPFSGCCDGGYRREQAVRYASSGYPPLLWKRSGV